MGKYDRQTANAIRTIKKKGRLCAWKSIGNAAAPDPSKPWKKGQRTATDEGTVSIVFLPNSTTTEAFLRALGNTSIVVGNDYGLMASVGFTPAIGDEIYDDTGTTLLRTLQNVNPLAPDGDIILYTLDFGVVS